MKTDPFEEFLAGYERGTYTRLELFQRIAHLVSGDNAKELVAKLPPDLQGQFRLWVSEHSEGYVNIGGEAVVAVSSEQIQKLKEAVDHSPE